MAERDPGLRRTGASVSVPWDASLPNIGFLDLWSLELWNPSVLLRTSFGPSPMPPPFHSLENPFEPPKKRLKDDAELIGKLLGRAAEEELRKIMAKEKRKPDETEPDWTPIR